MNAERKPLPRTIRGGRPFFFADPAIDKLLNMVVTLASEVWALRERLAAVEGAQLRRGALVAGEIDAFEFSDAEEARLGADRKEFIENLFRILQEQVEAAAARSDSARRKAEARPSPFGARGARAAKGGRAAGDARAAVAVRRPAARSRSAKGRARSGGAAKRRR
jgi:hypothetical protein